MKSIVTTGLDLVIVDASRKKGFNRGLLLDIAVKYMPNYNYYIFHDIDILPDQDILQYYYKYPISPIQLAPRGTRYCNIPEYNNNSKYFLKYFNTLFIGSIFSISREQILKVNGFPTNINKWGSEDDILRNRLLNIGIGYEYPPKGSVIDLEDTSFNINKLTTKMILELPEEDLNTLKLSKKKFIDIKKLYPETKIEILRLLRIKNKLTELGPNRIRAEEKKLLTTNNTTGIKDLETLLQSMNIEIKVEKESYYYYIVL